MTLDDCDAIRRIARSHRLEWLAPQQLKGRVPTPVFSQLVHYSVYGFLVESSASDTQFFSARYGYPLDDCANTLILKYKKNGTTAYAAAICTGARRLDVNGAIKQLLAAQRISFARAEITTELTGMVPGGITVFGLPADWPVLIDRTMLCQSAVIMGGGTREVKLVVPTRVLSGLPSVIIGNLSLPV